MKILVTIPHYYNPDNGKHGSGRKDPSLRINALEKCLFNLNALFSTSQCFLNIAKRTTEPVNQQFTNNVDIVVCTANNKQILDHLKFKPFTQRNTELENPRMLGFECQKVLKENINKYDYYCFMEDDLIINDSLFFEKLNWFSQRTDFRNILQPNRYESSTDGEVLKVYVDGDINPNATKNFQNINDETYLHSNFLGRNIVFKRPLNPHSGCFFLTNEQMNYWIGQDYFLDYDTSFISPLESSASLGVAKTFKLYKPDNQNANFLEIQHFGDDFLRLIKDKPVDIK